MLLAKVGTTGIPVAVDTDTPFNLFVSVALLKFNNELLNLDFLVNEINSPLVQSITSCRKHERSRKQKLSDERYGQHSCGNTFFTRTT